MKITPWSPEQKPQPEDLVQSVITRRGGKLLNLDRVLLWSAPLARAWNGYLSTIRGGLGLDDRTRELAICVIALVKGARYEYGHHAPIYLAAGGQEAVLQAVARYCENAGSELTGLAERDSAVVRYVADMARNAQVSDAILSELKRHCDTTELVEITAVAATYMMVAHVLLALDVAPEH